MKTKYFFILLALDFISKRFMEHLAPHNSFFYLTYNPDMIMSIKSIAFGIDFSILVKYVIPALMAPLFYISCSYGVKMNQISSKNFNLGFPILAAGLVGNYMDRFFSAGVIDFLNFQFCVANFADIYQWVGYAVILSSLAKPVVQEKAA